MYFPEIDLPLAVPLPNADFEVSRKVSPLASSIPSLISEAAIALNLFEIAKLQKDAIMPSFWFTDEPERGEQASKVILPDNRPDSYYGVALLMHAKSFVIALRTIGVLMETISSEAGSLYPRLQQIADEYDASFPRLKDLRDSISHIEDRLRGMARKKVITPTEVPGITIGGGVLFNGFLHNRSLGWTLADGSYGQCEISEGSLRTAVGLVEKLMAALFPISSLESSDVAG